MNWVTLAGMAGAACLDDCAPGDFPPDDFTPAAPARTLPWMNAGVDDNDDVLMLAWTGGDAAAFELLYDRVAGSVFGVIRRVLRDPAQSEEVAQEVLVEVWRTATRFDGDRGSASTWIHTMAHRRAIDRVRSSRSWEACADRTRSIARRWAIVWIQVDALPRSPSNRVAVRHTSTSTSWATSSDWAGSRRTRRITPNTEPATRS